MLRMLWLRQRVPDARVETSLVSIDDRAAVMSAMISLPDGGQGSGHSAALIDSETNLADAVEAAETQAIGRALDVLGYVVTESSSDATAQPPTPPPPPASREDRRSEPPGHVQALRQMKNRDRPHQTHSPPESAPVAPNPEMQEAAAEPHASTTQPAHEPAPSTPVPPGRPTADDPDEPELEDISWTAFWDWARATYQLKSRGQLEELLGLSVGNKNPGQLRQLLIDHFSEDADDES